MYLFLILKTAFSTLFIWSPHEIAQSTNEVSIASFGDPFLYQRYGKLVLITNNNDCSIKGTNLKNSFAVLYGYPKCFFSDLAISVQSLGGIGMIRVRSDEDIDILMVPKDSLSGDLIKILVISIKKSLGTTLSLFKNKEIWASYWYQQTQSEIPKISYYMSSNYSEDSSFINPIMGLSSISLNNFLLKICYCNTCPNVALKTDCITDSLNNLYCLPASSNVSGYEKLMNSVIILNYLSSLKNATTEDFFAYFSKLVLKCSYDYSIECNTKVLSDFNAQPDRTIKVSYFNYVDYSDSNYALINNLPFYWKNYIETGYCLSFLNPSSSCSTCSKGCSFSDLNDNTCSLNCNTSSCGYDNLKCLGSNGCYSFIYNDGNCNPNCKKDSDCTNASCSPGCSYSDTKNGLCPLACSNACFSLCNSSVYCSPGCSYSNLNNGLCTNCSESCLTSCKYSNNSWFTGLNLLVIIIPLGVGIVM